MRSKWLYDKGEVVYEEIGGKVTFDKRDHSQDAGYFVQNDCQPFKSMVDGRIINSKSVYREHLREHGCIEVGNDSSVMNPVRKPLKSPPGLKQEIINQARRRGCI